MLPGELLILASYLGGVVFAMVVKKPGLVEVTDAPADTTDDLDRVASPTTTAEQDRHAVGQRRVNLVWEFTQAFIAVSLTGAYIYAQMQTVESPSLNNSFFLVVGFYFGRTNHQRVGGVEGGR